ncbi:MAG TPA: hypothetical protein VK897_19560 [Anaerolineales bacterium]|nr:hypothetical protein [Anaerolineales bacterium]HSL45641.1 hypothetical protein [Anaerolineales bacterium]
MNESDPQERDWERELPRTELKDSIRRRLPQAADPPPLPELEPFTIPEPEAPLEETSPNRPFRRRIVPPAAVQRVVAALYLLTILVLLFVVIRYMFIRSPDRETLIYFGLPLLAIGYLAREMLNWSGGSNGDKDV